MLPGPGNAKETRPLEGRLEQALLIFTRNPEPGKCKTRLAATIGDRAALDIYIHLLRHTAAACAVLDTADKYVYFSEHPGDGSIWNPETFRQEVQAGPDLGARMQHAFETAFARGYRRVVLIGSDLPDLTTADLQNAFSALNTHETVIGPAADGGYYLIGLTRMIPGLFEDKPWGSSRVLEATLSDLSGIAVSLLSEKNDVDRYEDIAGRPEFQRYLKSHPNDPETAG